MGGTARCYPSEGWPICGADFTQCELYMYDIRKPSFHAPIQWLIMVPCVLQGRTASFCDPIAGELTVR